MTVRAVRCYVEHIAELQRYIDGVVEEYPETRGVVPTFTHFDNFIGNHLVTGLPIQDPFIVIEWDTEA